MWGKCAVDRGCGLPVVWGNDNYLGCTLYKHMLLVNKST